MAVLDGTGTDGGGIGQTPMAMADATSALEAIGNTVHFETDSYSLTAEAQSTLQKQAAWMKQNPQYGITIEGHEGRWPISTVKLAER